MSIADSIFGMSLGEMVSPKADRSPAPEVARESYAKSEARDSAAETSGQTTPMSELARRVMDWFSDAFDARRDSGMDERLSYCLRSQVCEFSDQEMEKLSQILGASVAKKVFVPLTKLKNRAAKSMLIDLANQSGEPLFRLEPTPVTEVPQEIADRVSAEMMQRITTMFSQMAASGIQEIPPEAMELVQSMIVDVTSERYDEVENAKSEYARSRAKRMQNKVWDSMVEGGFNDAFADFISNVCIYGTGVIVGPVSRVVPVNRCVEDKKKKVRRYERRYDSRIVFESVNPQDVYPAPNAKSVDDGPICMRVRYTRDALWRYAEAKDGSDPDGSGWIVSAVRGIIVRHPDYGVKIAMDTYDRERRVCERNGFNDSTDCNFDGIRCFASVRGSDLVDMGIVVDRLGKKIDRERFYRTETIVIDNRVVYCRIYDDALGVPVSKGTFYELPGSWWGESIADTLRMTQTTLNNVIRAMLVNMSASSNGIVWINDVQRMYNKSPNALRVKAGMTIPFSQSIGGGQGAPIGVINVPSTAAELIQVWKTFQTQADIDSGIPAYTEGQTSGQSGALRTAQGLAMFTEASNRGMKMVMTSIDRCVISRIARLTADYILVNDPDQELKGDVNVMPVGLVGKIMKAQRDQQRVALFNLIVQNQMLSQLIGPTGIIELLRPSLDDVDINPDDILPSKGRIKELETMANIRQLFEATSAASGAEENAAAQEGAGAPPGISQPPQVQSGVAERRAVA